MNAVLAEEITITLPSLKQKFLVDLVNGIDVSNDLIKVQKARGGFLNRLWDSVIGDSHRRQTQLNEQVVNGLDNCFEWLGDLTEELTFTNTALVQVSDGLARVKSDLTFVACFSADTRERLGQFEATVNCRMADLETMIREVDMRQRAYQQMDSLFMSWRVGDFLGLSAAQRCFLVLTELTWGVFTDYTRIATVSDREQILKDLKNKLTMNIALDIGVEPDIRIDANVWLENKSDINGLHYEMHNALSFLGNQLSPELHDFNRYILDPSIDRPATVPHIMAAQRLVDGLLQERVRGDQLYVR